MSKQTLINGESYLSHRTKINDNFTEVYDAGLQVALIEDQKASNTDGGGYTAGAYSVRDLNTIVYNGITGLSLSGNQVTIPAGTYEFEWSCPYYIIVRNQTRLRDITNNLFYYGSSEYGNNVSGDVASRSGGKTIVTITGNTSFDLQHRGSSTRLLNGFGVSNAFGNICVYSQLKITKLITP